MNLLWMLGCTPTCTGASCLSAYDAADILGARDASGDLRSDAAETRVSGESDEGGDRAFATLDGALLVGVPGASRLDLYRDALFLGFADVSVGGEPGESFGAAVASREVTAVGAPSYRGGPALRDLGAVWIFPWATPDLGASLDDALSVLTGRVAGDGLGSTLSWCGENLLIAATGAQELAGEVYRVPGESLSGEIGEPTWVGKHAGSGLGRALGCLGETAVLGEPFWDGAGAGRGAVRLSGEVEVVIEGAWDSAYFGSAVAAGDLDGDGALDLAVGAPGRPEADADADDLGGSIAVYGSTRLGAGDAPSVRILGSDARGRLGSTVVLGDADGDGRLDLLAGAPGESGQAGALYVWLGPFTTPAFGRTTLLGLDDAYMLLSGARAYERVGEQAALIDLDASGQADVIFTVREEGE